MKKWYFVLFLISFLIVSFLFCWDFKPEEAEVKGLNTIPFENEPNITITPELNISRFFPYVISSNNIPGTPQSVFIELWGKNGNGDTTCWDYYVDGRCGSSNLIKNMTYSDGLWSTGNIYPDSIYPEIYFASSEITWKNTPLSASVRRNNYQIMHFNNPFVMTSDMYLYVEFNALPVSTVNSADLQVYLVGKDLDITKFNTNWIDTEGVELIGTFNKNAEYHHTHSSNSSHKLVPLLTNSDGTIGSKHIDVSEDFWVVLYSQSPNNNRGWNLLYQPSSLCTNENRWYMGDISGWKTTYQNGCPDSHVHVARRESEHMDGIGVVLSANYGDSISVSQPVSFYFGELPNVPPISTAFLSPQIGGTYSGNIDINWDPSSDANNDPITYNIYLKQGADLIDTLASSTSSTSISSFQTSSYPDGSYTLEGEVCDSVNPCVPFSLNGNFSISNTLPIQSLSEISISSSNPNTSFAKSGDTLTLTFLSTGTILNPEVSVYSGGDSLNDEETFVEEGNLWTYSYTVLDSDTDGFVTFSIMSDTLDKEYYETTSPTSILIDNTPPQNPQFSTPSGTYSETNPVLVSLSSEGAYQIRYTLDNISPSCDIGNMYSSPFELSSNITVKAIACDSVGNISNLVSSEYLFKADLENITITSSNTHAGYAKYGDVISLIFESTSQITSPLVEFYIGEENLIGNVEVVNLEDNVWEALYEIPSGSYNDDISFVISSADLYDNFTTTTDQTGIFLDNISPLEPVSSLEENLYSSIKLVELSSSGAVYIRYTIDGSIPSCSSGNIYLAPFTISSSTIMNVIGCDLVGNGSEIASFNYLFLNATTTLEDKEEVIDEEKSTYLKEEIQETDDQPQEEEDNMGIPADGIDLVEVVSSTGNYKVDILRRGIKLYLSEFRVKILDEEGLPLDGLRVSLHSDVKEGVTDINGISIFNEVEVGEHVLSFEYDGRMYRRVVSTQNPEPLSESLEAELVIVKIAPYDKKDILYYILGFLVLASFSFSFWKKQKKK